MLTEFALYKVYLVVRGVEAVCLITANYEEAARVAKSLGAKIRAY